MRTGWDVRPSFSVSQNDDRQEVLELIRNEVLPQLQTFLPSHSSNELRLA